MLQSINTTGQVSWPTSIVDSSVNRPETWRRSVRSKLESGLQKPSVGDVALLYPEAVVASSDALWMAGCPRDPSAAQLELRSGSALR